MIPHVPDGFTLHRFNYLKSIETNSTHEVLLPNDVHDLMEESVNDFRKVAQAYADEVKGMFLHVKL